MGEWADGRRNGSAMEGRVLCIRGQSTINIESYRKLDISEPLQ